MMNLLKETQKVVDLLTRDYESFCFQRDMEVRQDRMYCFEEGRNYIKLIMDDNGRCSVAGFIVKKSPKPLDNKTKAPFKVGDLLMAAGYNAPATNFARGNVFDDSTLGCITWTGVQ